jgi:hypothetical protein
MTITTGELRAAADEDLATWYQDGDEADRRAALGEADRRNRREAARRERGEERAAWESGAYAQYLQADAELRGNLVNRRGMAAGIDDWSLWSGTEARALAYATEELRLWWQDPAHPRITVTDYRRQVSDGHRIQRDETAAEELWDEAGPEDQAELHGGTGMAEVTAAPAQPELPGIRYSQIVGLDAEWLWDGMIAAGELTILAAAGGTGKTFAMCDVTARVTRGEAMPDGTPAGPAGSVIIVSAEDDPGTVMVHRLRAAGADLERVLDLSEVHGGQFTLPACLPALREAIRALGDVRLVILDPLAGVSDVSLTSVVAVRHQIMRPLQQLARETGAAIVAIHHLTKAGSVAGSRAIVDTARSVLMAERDREDPDVRIISVHKSNMAAGAKPVRYRIDGQGRAARCAWLSQADADEAQQDARPAHGNVLDTLRAADTPLTGQQIAAATGLPYLDVRRELARLEQDGQVSSPARGLYAPGRPGAGERAAAAEGYAARMAAARESTAARYAEVKAMMREAWTASAR